MTIASTVINQLSTTQANFQGFVNFWGGVWTEIAKGLDSYTNPSSSEPARNGGLSSMIGAGAQLGTYLIRNPGLKSALEKVVPVAAVASVYFAAQEYDIAYKDLDRALTSGNQEQIRIATDVVNDKFLGLLGQTGGLLMTRKLGSRKLGSGLSLSHPKLKYFHGTSSPSRIRSRPVSRHFAGRQAGGYLFG